MSGYRVKKRVDSFAKVISFIVLILLFIGLLGALVYLFMRPQGLYVRYGETVIADNNTSLVLFDDSDEVNFIIEHANGWGEYLPQDCTVTIIPYASESQNFDFYVAGENTSRAFNDEADLTSAFVATGEKIVVDEDGVFELTFKCKDMISVLEAIYGKDKVSLTGYPDISAYPYFAIRVVSPDGNETIVIPFRCHYTVPSVVPSGISLDKDVVYI